PEHAGVLAASRKLADYFEAVVAAGAEPRDAANWVRGELLALLNRSGVPISDLRVAPSELARLLEALASGGLPRPAAKRVLARMAETGEGARAAIEAEGLGGEEAPGALAEWVEEAVASHPAEAERFRA